jgi:HK97 family phage major capsid protein
MKTARMIELERQRVGLVEEARSILNEIKTNPDDKSLEKLERKHDQLMRDLDLNKLDIDEEELREQHLASQRPPMGGESYADGRPIYRGTSGWADTDGNPVRVLRSNENLSEQRVDGVALGDAVRAMVTGPRNEAEKRALSEGTTSAGGYTVPTPLATWFIDRLRAQSVAIRAGAVTVPMTSQTLAIARLETDPAIGWRAENAGIATGDPTFGRVLLTAKSLAGIVKVSRELLMDTVNAGAMIEQALAKTMALEIDRAAIYGDGTSNSPTGVVNTSGINSVSMGTNGATVASVGYDKMLDAVYELMLDNAADPTAAIMHPRTAIALQKLKDTANNPLLIPDMVARVPKLTTTAAPITETQGTANNASSVVLGDFSQLMIGVREEITIRMLDQIYAENGQIALLVHARADMQLAHKESFCKLVGIIP